jgi:hypothetical protein
MAANGSGMLSCTKSDAFAPKTAKWQKNAI